MFTTNFQLCFMRLLCPQLYYLEFTKYKVAKEKEICKAMFDPDI